jgi:hypothetical protein
MLKTRVEPVTPWLSEAYTTRLLFQLCCCVSYYFFVLCSGVLIRSNKHGNRTHLSGLVNMVVGATYQVLLL